MHRLMSLNKECDMQVQTQTRARGSVSPIHANHPMLFGCIELKGASVPYQRNEEIFGEGEPAEYVYKVLSGSVRSYNLLADGRRQINGFYLPDDILGLELSSDHSSSAEAVTDCAILVVKRNTLLKGAERDNEI